MAAMPRARIGSGRVEGTVDMFSGRYGWIIPSAPVKHPSASKHGGKIYLNQKDVEGGAELKKGDTVTFFVYADASGIGAMNCLAKRVQATPAAKAGAGGNKPKAAASTKGAGGKEGASGEAAKAQADKPGAKHAGKAMQGASGPPKAAAGVQKTIQKPAPKASANFAPASAKARQQAAKPPTSTPPKSSPPKASAPKASAPKASAPKAAAPKASAPKASGSTAPSNAGAGQPQATDRKRTSWKRQSGTIISFGAKFGWIEAAGEIDHEDAHKSGGRLFVSAEDVEESLREKMVRGAKVTFVVYADAQGLGADQVKLQADTQATPAPRADAPSGKAAPKGAAAAGKAAVPKVAAAAGKAAPKAAPKAEAASKEAGKDAGKDAGKGGGKPGKAAGKASGMAAGASSSGKATGKSIGSAFKNGSGPGVRKAIVKKDAPAPPKEKPVPQVMPPFWEEHWSDEYGVPYFWNSKTKESRWVRPEK